MSIWQVQASSLCSWNWRKILHLRSLTYSFIERRDDGAVWKYLGSKYSAAVIWNEIGPKQDKKDWHRLLWTSLMIPRHVIVVWMAILNRLPTLDRMSSWGLVQDGKCRLCQNALETRDHLFFACSFSKKVWGQF